MIHIIRRIWLPRTMGALALWYAQFALKFAEFADELGLTSYVAQVDKDNTHIQWLAAALEAGEANNRQLKQFRDESLFAEASDPAPAPPVTTLPAEPEAFQTSIIHRLVDLVEKKIETADNYTEAIGVQLGIVVPTGSPVSPGDVKPTATYSSAQSGYELGVLVAGRAEATMSELQIRFEGTETWISVKNFTGNAVSTTLTPPEAGKPFRVQARIQLYKNNAKYGQPSDPVYVTLNP